MQNEIKKPQNILDQSGNLSVSGWAHEPILEYDRSDIKNSFLKGREWDHYVIYNTQYAVSLMIANYGYVGLATAMLMDFRGETRRYGKTKIKLFPLDKINMPNSAKAGDANYSDRRLGMKFSRSANNRFIKNEFMNFNDGKLLNVSIALEDLDINTIAVTSTFPGKSGAFAYLVKDVGMTANGFVKFGGEEFLFDASDTRAFLSWGRCVLPYENRWYWSAFSTTIRNKPFSINFGGGLGDTSKGSENAVFYDGRLYKLSAFLAQVPKDPAGQSWKFSTKDRRVLLSFKPFMNCKEKKQLLTTCLEQNLIFGHFNGQVTLDDGQKFTIDNLAGFAHWVYSRF